MAIIVTVPDVPARTYHSLQQDIARWLARTDLSNEIKRFIQMAEADICDKVRIRGMVRTVLYDADGAPQALPTGFLGARRLTSESCPQGLTFKSPRQFFAQRDTEQAGNPSVYTIEGETLYFAPAGSSESPTQVTMAYLGPFEGLADPQDSNSLLDKHYNVYLYAALKHGFSFLRDDEQAVKYGAEFENVVQTLNLNSIAESHSGDSLKRTGGWAP